MKTGRRKSNRLRKWNNPDDKKAAYLAVLKKIMADKKFCERCLASEEFARDAFRTIGQIEVPEDAKVVFVPEGDLDKAKRDGTGSIVIEMPPRKKGRLSRPPMEYVRCTYDLW